MSCSGFGCAISAGIGSSIVQVDNGVGEVEFEATDGRLAFATIEAGNTIIFDPDEFTFTGALDNISPVNVIADGQPLVVFVGTDLTQLVADLQADLATAQAALAIAQADLATTLTELGAALDDLNAAQADLATAQADLAAAEAQIIEICHNDEETLSVSAEEIAAHTAHDDELGPCDDDDEVDDDVNDG